MVKIHKTTCMTLRPPTEKLSPRTQSNIFKLLCGPTNCPRTNDSSINGRNDEATNPLNSWNQQVCHKQVRAQSLKQLATFFATDQTCQISLAVVTTNSIVLHYF